ncbi:hypothetical protein ACKQTC_08245 [Peptococcus simiae]|uniref:Uncharacterized protein n=1 Tax=Peptococcus simiae TaxID=1643805 RepID=A0ABW9H0H0_9FIRM
MQKTKKAQIHELVDEFLNIASRKEQDYLISFLQGLLFTAKRKK